MFEITSALIRELDGRTSSRAFIPPAFLCAAAIGTAFIVGILPHSRIPIDRGQLFFAFLLIFLCGWAIFIPTSSQLVRGITQGLAFYALVSLVATIGRALASAHNHSGRYATWSYTLVCVEGWSAIAWWSGLRFDDLLRAYPPMSQAKWVRVESSVNLDASGNPDPYFVSLDLPTARHPQTLLATHFNGQPLPRRDCAHRIWQNRGPDLPAPAILGDQQDRRAYMAKRHRKEKELY